MIYMTNPFLLPILFMVGSADAWLFIATLRLMLRHCSEVRARQISDTLGHFADPLPNWLESQVRKVIKRPMSTRVTWLVTMVSVFTVRSILVCLIVQLSTH